MYTISVLFVNTANSDISDVYGLKLSCCYKISLLRILYFFSLNGTQFFVYLSTMVVLRLVQKQHQPLNPTHKNLIHSSESDSYSII